MAEQPEQPDESDRRFVALSIQVEVFEPDSDDPGQFMLRSDGFPRWLVMEHFTREARSIVVELNRLPDTITSELHGLVANAFIQLHARYDDN